ncbi:MAG: amidohydrolase family protein, partial [Candidatus Eisenbacteria bacterium]|nr:amidohydrolase family protein [Candidatus Eisenbacteria bacterium]
MTPADFTLRDALPASAGRDEPPCDFVFRAGRLAAKRPGSPGARPRLYLSPGFRDAHVHLLHVGLRDQRCDLGGAGSLAEALEMVAAFAREREGGGILWAENWDESGWPEGRGPLGDDLDRVVPDRPAVMRRVCGHKAVLNGRARAEAALRWPDLDRRGVVTEERAMRLASVWPPTPEERERALRSAQGRALSMGIVRVGEMGSDGALDAFLELRKRNALRIDVDYFVRPSQIELALRLRAEGWLAGGGLRLGGVKLFADGSIGARTAALREPYADGAGRGELLYDDDELAALLRRCLEAELPVAVHAIGDAAIDQVAGRLEAIAGASGPLPAGWASIEHAELLTGDLLERCAALGVRLSMQPNFVARWGGAGGLYERALGPDRWRAMNPWRSALAAGLPVVFGSDGMPMDPAIGLVGATTHPQPEQRLSPAEAL